MKKINNISNWLSSIKRKNFFLVKKKKLSNLKKWKISKNNIYHQSGKFFKIVGVKIKSNYFKNSAWEQPLVNQNEIGILGILRRKYKNKFEYLIQAKIEPGNINTVQFSPTVQATKSNMNRVHSGKKVKYLNFFKNAKKRNISISLLQSEQGERYLFKFNKNMIVDTDKNLKIGNNYIWLTKYELKKLINKNNLLNMDCISVFSCAIQKNILDLPKHSLLEIKKWFKKLDKKYFVKRKILPLSKLKNWKFNKGNFCHKNDKYFSIVGVTVRADSREVSMWDQPMIREKNIGLSGFIVKKINSTYHYLVRFSLKPGLKNSGLSCTVRTSDMKNCLKNKNYPSLMKDHIKKYFTNTTNSKIIYNKIQSDEGGRFFHSRSKNIVVQISEKEKIKLDPGYIWMSHNQILHFVKKGIFNIEARILFTCFNIEKIL